MWYDIVVDDLLQSNEDDANDCICNSMGHLGYNYLHVFGKITMNEYI